MDLLICPREDIFLEVWASIFKNIFRSNGLTLASRRLPIFFSCLDGFSALIVLGVGLLDMSSFAKFIIMGESRSVVNYLQMLCSNDVDIPVGGIIPTGMLNENGLSSSSLAINILLYTHTYTTTICTSSYLHTHQTHMRTRSYQHTQHTHISTQSTYAHTTTLNTHSYLTPPHSIHTQTNASTF